MVFLAICGLLFFSNAQIVTAFHDSQHLAGVGSTSEQYSSANCPICDFAAQPVSTVAAVPPPPIAPWTIRPVSAIPSPVLVAPPLLPRFYFSLRAPPATS